MSNYLTELFERAGQVKTSADDIVYISFETLLRFFIAICRAVCNRDVGVPLAAFMELAKEVDQAIKNRDAAESRKGVYILDGLVYSYGQLVESLRGRNLEIVLYIIQRGGVSLQELKQRFWKRNDDEEETSDKNVMNTIYIISDKTAPYNFEISYKDSKYRISKLSYWNFS